MAPEDFTVEQSKFFDIYIIQLTRFFIALEKRHDRRERISRPKKSINFNLDNNMVREFRITDIVQRDDTVIKSAERNTPKTAGRLVKLNDGKKDEDNQ